MPLLEHLIKIKDIFNQSEEVASDVFHPEYGWIILHGQVTEEGIKMFQDYSKK